MGGKSLIKPKKSQPPKSEEIPEPLNLEELIIPEPELSEEEKAAQYEKEQRAARISEDLKRVKKEAGIAFGLKCDLETQFREAEREIERKKEEFREFLNCCLFFIDVFGIFKQLLKKTKYYESLIVDVI